jgi:DNA-binding NarL/FixJ family response regulator
MARHSNIAVLICDLKMPGISGLELLNWARAQYPDVTRMVLTAYGQTTTVLSALNTGHAFRFLMKPWRLEEDFIPSVHEAIAFHLMHREKAALAEKVARLSLQAQNQQAQIKELTENIRRHRTVIVRLGHWLKEQPEGVSFSWDELKSQAEWLEILAVMEGGGSEPPPS